MRCPACEGQLEERVHGALTLDRCAACRGVWFDAGELRAYSAKRGAELGEDALHRAFARLAAVPVSCPACAAGELRSGVVADVALRGCGTCGGFFLPGESLGGLRALAARARAEGRRGRLLSRLDAGDFGQALELLVEVVDAVIP